MPTKAASYRKGISSSAGRSRSSTSGVGGAGNTVKPLRANKMHGGRGRDERHTSGTADYGNQLTKNPTPGEHRYK